MSTRNPNTFRPGVHWQVAPEPPPQAPTLVYFLSLNPCVQWQNTYNNGLKPVPGAPVVYHLQQLPLVPSASLMGAVPGAARGGNLPPTGVASPAPTPTIAKNDL